MEILKEIALAIIPALIVGIIMANFNKQQKKRDERQMQADEQRQKNESLKLNLLLATAQLSYAVAMAIKRGSPNGEIEEGVEQYNKALEKFRVFEREQLTKI